MAAYYNEIDPYAAQWLRNLIAAGHIAPGEVDERSIEDVTPDDLRGFIQHHFFAGIGVWSHALRLAGWPDDQPVWTGSCPCQPFSAAGKGNGFADERHLWPAFHFLISECRPAIVFGEQVASKDAEPWLDLVQDDMEAMDYAFGAVAFPAAGIGAPHIRDRSYWVADANECISGQRRADVRGRFAGGDAQPRPGLGRMGDAEPTRLQERVGLAGVPGGSPGASEGQTSQRAGIHVSGLEQPSSVGRERGQAAAPGHQHDGQASEWPQGQHGPVQSSPHRVSQDGTGPTHGFWRDADWLLCRDGKWRPVEPGTFPLAHRAPARVGRLRAYGNAIVATQAAHVISAVMEVRL